MKGKRWDQLQRPFSSQVENVFRDVTVINYINWFLLYIVRSPIYLDGITGVTTVSLIGASKSRAIAFSGPTSSHPVLRFARTIGLTACRIHGDFVRKATRYPRLMLQKRRSGNFQRGIRPRKSAVTVRLAP